MAQRFKFYLKAFCSWIAPHAFLTHSSRKETARPTVWPSLAHGVKRGMSIEAWRLVKTVDSATPLVPAHALHLLPTIWGQELSSNKAQGSLGDWHCSFALALVCKLSVKVASRTEWSLVKANHWTLPQSSQLAGFLVRRRCQIWYHRRGGRRNLSIGQLHGRSLSIAAQESQAGECRFSGQLGCGSNRFK